jgi:hypothetical protein
MAPGMILIPAYGVFSLEDLIHKIISPSKVANFCKYTKTAGGQYS